MSKKIRFEIDDNYLTVFNAGQKVFVRYYTRSRDAKRGALRLAKKHGISTPQIKMV